MPKHAPVSASITAAFARTQLGSLLKQITDEKARFVITKGGKPTAVLLGIDDFDDIVEELDPAFQKSLKVASQEYTSGKAVTLQDCLKGRLAKKASR